MEGIRKNALTMQKFGWNKASIGALLATVPLVYPSINMMGNEFSRYLENGHSDDFAFIMSFAEMGGTLSFAGMAGHMVAKHGIAKIAKYSIMTFQETMKETKDFFNEMKIKRKHRQSIFLRDKLLSGMLEEALNEAGVKFSKKQFKEFFVFSGKRISMEIQVKKLLKLPKNENIDYISIAPQSLGNLAPTMLLRNSDGAFAMWVDEKNNQPTHTVGFDKEGKVDWIYDHVTKTKHNSQSFTGELPDLKNCLLSSGDHFVTEDEYTYPDRIKF